MLTVTAIVVVDIVVRLGDWEGGYREGVPTLPAVLSVIAGGLVAYGAAYGGSLVYDYGFNVETAGDHPAWHESERDVLPGEDKEIAG